MNNKTQKINVKDPSMAATSASIQSSNSSMPNRQESVSTSVVDQALLIIVSFVFLSTIGLTISRLVRVRRRKNRYHSSYAPSLGKRSCQRCQYFSSNPYLKCAIHPATVMTEAANDCNDYTPNH
jgi:hypothetical protein